MSIKTLKRIALGVIASLVFAPFAAIAPASAAVIAAITVDVTVDEGVLTVTATIDDDDDVADAYLEVLQSPDPAVPVGLVTNITIDGVVTETAYVDGDDEIIWTFDEEITTVGLYRFRVFADSDADAAFTAGTDVAAVGAFSAVAADLVAAAEVAVTLGLDAGDFGLSFGAGAGVAPANGDVTVGGARGVGVSYVGTTHTKTPSTRDVVEIFYSAATASNLELQTLEAAVTTADRYLTFTISGPATWELGTAGVTSYSSGNQVIKIDEADPFAVTDSLPFALNGTGTVTITVRDVLESTLVGTVIGTYTVYSVTTATAGTYSADDSFARLQTSSTALTEMPDPAIDVVGANKVSATGTGYLAMYLRDIYDGAITDTNSALVATATGGALIAWSNAAPTQSTSVLTTGLSTPVLYIKAGTAGTSPVTVEVKLNGVTVATKTLSFTGAASTIAISAKKTSIAAGEATANAFKYAISDTAGTRIASSATVTAVDGVYVTSATASAGSATAVSGVEVTCSALLGKGSVTLTYATTKTEVVEVICAGGIASFEVTTSKSAYDRAEIGVLTISAKDLAGQPVADGTDLATAAGKIQFTGSGATLAKTVAATDEFVDGKIDYAFTTSATAGSYNFALWHGDLSPAVTKIAAFTVNAAAVAPSYTKPTLTSSVEGGRVLLFGACEADEGDMVVYVKRPGGAWNEKAKTLECVAGEFDGSIKAPKSTRLFRVKQEGTGLWSGSVLARP